MSQLTGAQFLLVSDFQRDDGQRLAAGLLAGQSDAKSVARLAVHTLDTTNNSWHEGIRDPLSLVPGRSSEWVLGVGGTPRGVRVSIDDGPLLEVQCQSGAGRLVVPLPPLSSGPHTVQVVLDDDGLLADDTLVMPIDARGAIPVVVVRSQQDWLAAALAADPAAAQVTYVRPADVAGLVLPERGLVAIRTQVGDNKRLRAWVEEGGILWAPHEVLRADPVWMDLWRDLDRDSATGAENVFVGGPLSSMYADLERSLGSAKLTQVDKMPLLSTDATVHLRAGTAPLVVSRTLGRGTIIMEAAALAREPAVTSRGALPTWVQRTVQKIIAARDQPPQLVNGQRHDKGIVLQQPGRRLAISAGAVVRARPGLWFVGEGTGPLSPLLILPDPDESRLDRVPPTNIPTTVLAALPHRRGADLGWWLLAAALLVMIIEGLVAAAAGRRYGV